MGHGRRFPHLQERQLGTWTERELLAAGILRGVRAVHDAGWVHRDLKPANILLALAPHDAVVPGERWIPKITDFGLARVTEEDAAGVTRAGEVLGSWAYMAPEQFEDPRSVDRRADVFALGAVLYEIATGRRAFAGATSTEIRAQIESGRYVAPREVVPDLPVGLEAAIRGALVADREQRLPDCTAMLRALQSGTSAKHARMGQQPQPAHRFAARLALAGALLAVATLVIVVTLPVRGQSSPTRQVPQADPTVQPPDPKPELSRPDPPPPPDPLERHEPAVPDPPPPAPRALTLTSDPSGASVFAGETEIGRTPLMVQVPVGDATGWTLRLDGFKEAVVVPPDGTGDAVVQTALGKQRAAPRPKPPSPSTGDIKIER